MALRECKERYTATARSSNILSLGVEYAVDQILTAKIAELDETLRIQAMTRLQRIRSRLTRARDSGDLDQPWRVQFSGHPANYGFNFSGPTL